MKPNIFNFLVTLSLLTTGPGSFAAAPLCRDVFTETAVLALSPNSPFPTDPATLRTVEQEIANSRAASQYFMSEMRKESDAIKKQYIGKVLELDWLCLGGGPQCAATSLVLGRTNLKAMVIEKSNLIAKTFAEKDFSINSTEENTLTMHDFPGGVGSLADYTSQKYAYSSQLAAHIQAQQFASNVPVLLNETMMGAHWNEKEGYFEITTENGITIHAKNFFVSTGLGEVGTKVTDENYKKTLAYYYKKHFEQPDTLFPIMSTDSILTAIKNAREDNKPLNLPKNIIIVGNGDGSRICIEKLHEIHPTGLHITWVGNTNKTAQQYVDSWADYDRYIHKVVPLYLRDQIAAVPGRAVSWHSRPDGTQHVTVSDEKNHTTNDVEGAMILDATGYNNTVPGLLEAAGAQTKMQDVRGSIPSMNLNNTLLAKQAVDSQGRPIPLYVGGAAGGPMATQQEVDNSPNPNPIAIFHTVPRTSAAVSGLIGAPALPSQRTRAERPTTLSAQALVTQANQKRQEQRQAHMENHLH